MNYNNKTKADLVEIIKQKEDEILELKGELRELEKCQRYEDISDEIRDMYIKLVNKGFANDAALSIVNTMISSRELPVKSIYRYSYASYSNKK